MRLALTAGDPADGLYHGNRSVEKPCVQPPNTSSTPSVALTSALLRLLSIDEGLLSASTLADATSVTATMTLAARELERVAADEYARELADLVLRAGEAVERALDRARERREDGATGVRARLDELALVRETARSVLEQAGEGKPA